MKTGCAIGAALTLIMGCNGALAEDVPDLKGTWIPANGAHLIDGPSKHQASGTTPVPGDATLHRDASKFVFRFEGQEGRTFWGHHASAKVTEKLIGVLSVDEKHFVMADEDGTFSGTIVDADTLDYCYTHVTPTDRAVACGQLLRQK
ncbi:hypothetical protein [Segnochrobactrum spirostomi]|uniref:Uncharacterized protein n=1 Tax=Segnochrobactrum spirostomi TaxID=2608987 RepID=A0A6A7Y0S3_9HYPH|nr:hypothetical protein [Segnochrobactrum spirostomi]MQT12088.1 hypothetical protein [Segnochrobactrum spirostomi]